MWFYKGGKCGCFVLRNKWFFEVNPPYGESDFTVPQDLNLQRFVNELSPITTRPQLSVIVIIFYVLSKVSGLVECLFGYNTTLAQTRRFVLLQALLPSFMWSVTRLGYFWKVNDCLANVPQVNFGGSSERSISSKNWCGYFLFYHCSMLMWVLRTIQLSLFAIRITFTIGLGISQQQLA